jgi:hypothetical protein
MKFAAHTIISCKYYYILLLWWLNTRWQPHKKDKRTPITTPWYQVPSVDAVPDQPAFRNYLKFFLHFLDARLVAEQLGVPNLRDGMIGRRYLL